MQEMFCVTFFLKYVLSGIFSYLIQLYFFKKGILFLKK